MRYQLESPGPSTRSSPHRRRASMASFERLSTRVLIVGSAVVAIAMTAFVCMTAHGFG